MGLWSILAPRLNHVSAGENPQFSVIWLHGLGASGDDFVPVVPELKLPESPAVRFLFPHAPVRPITINGGMAMRGWYDITSLEFDSREEDGPGIKESASQVTDLIEHEISRGISANSILLAGFSQGGAIALYTGLTGKHLVGGILALSTYLPIHDEALPQMTDAHRALPVFMAHGQYDDVIQIQYAERSRDVLQGQNIDIEWRTYPMPHSVSPEEISDIAAWFKQRMS